MIVHPVVTIGKARRAARGVLGTVSDTAALDADLLLSQALLLERNMLDMLNETELDLVEQQRFEKLLTRRMAGEPIAYITQSKAFWSIEVKVGPSTLVPRPETELVVERAIFHCRHLVGPMIADLGTGTGCIALALATELKDAGVVATDRSADALKIAQQNQQSLGLKSVDFRLGDWLDALPPSEFDIIVANPPYIADKDPCLEDPAMRFEPRLALCGGLDGLDCIRSIVSRARSYLKPGGWLIIEHGYSQGHEVRQLFDVNQFGKFSTFNDLAGLERVTEGQRR